MKNYGVMHLEKRTFGFFKKIQFRVSSFEFQVEEKIFKISLICVPNK